MSKIFTLRDWIYLPDAARHLTERFNEPVTEQDVLTLALEGRLTLSIRFQSQVAVRRVERVNERPQGSLGGTYLSIGQEPVQFLQLSPVVSYVDGALDLPMIGGERALIRAREWSEDSTWDDITFDEILLKDQQGCLFVMLTRKPIEEWKEPFQNIENYSMCYELPESGRLVVRTQAIREMEQSLDQHGGKADLNAKERTSYLNILGGLLALMLEAGPLGKTRSGYDDQAAIIDGLLARYPGAAGLSKRNLEAKFAEAKRTLSGRAE